MLLERHPRPAAAPSALDPNEVTRIVIGHGHWDHAGQLSEFPDASALRPEGELKQIDFFLNYPTEFNSGQIRAVNTIDPLTGAQVGPPRRRAHGARSAAIRPRRSRRSWASSSTGKAKIIDGRHQVAPGLIIHPAFRGHTYGSQLLQVNTARGQLVFGSDTYSSWTGIRDWLVANIQQTDTIQQFLAYEKCYVLTSQAEQLPQLHRGARADFVQRGISHHVPTGGISPAATVRARPS